MKKGRQEGLEEGRQEGSPGRYRTISSEKVLTPDQIAEILEVIGAWVAAIACSLEERVSSELTKK